MQTRNDNHRKDAEPKVIAISATRQAVPPAIYWAAGLAMTASAWLSLLLQ